MFTDKNLYTAYLNEKTQLEDAYSDTIEGYKKYDNIMYWVNSFHNLTKEEEQNIFSYESVEDKVFNFPEEKKIEEILNKNDN